MLLWQLKKFLESRKSNEIKFQFRTAGFISLRRLPKWGAYPNPFNKSLRALFRIVDSLRSSSSLYFSEGRTQTLSTKCFAFRCVFCFSSVYKSKLLTQLRNKKPCPENRDRVCAQNRNRTCTSLRTLDFESSASTNSAIWAGLQYYAINENLPKYDLGIFSCSNTPLFAAFLLGK